MSHRNSRPLPRIVEAVIAQRGAAWNESTQKVARTDAERILEALVAEAGVEGSVAALERQGFDGMAYRYLLRPLVEEALRRRHRSTAPDHADRHPPLP